MGGWIEIIGLCCSLAAPLLALAVAAHRYGVSARVWLAVHTPKERVGLSPAACCCLAAATNHTHTHTSVCGGGGGGGGGWRWDRLRWGVVWWGPSTDDPPVDI